MSLMFSPWRLPKLDRIGVALASYDACGCRECRRKVMRAIEAYDRGKR